LYDYAYIPLENRLVMAATGKCPFCLGSEFTVSFVIADGGFIPVLEELQRAGRLPPGTEIPSYELSSTIIVRCSACQQSVFSVKRTNQGALSSQGLPVCDACRDRALRQRSLDDEIAQVLATGYHPGGTEVCSACGAKLRVAEWWEFKLLGVEPRGMRKE
jgi:hypothetical protein